MSEPKNEQSKMRQGKDAIERFERWRDKDPYPKIFPALLNSADIHDYIETTGMVYPYEPRLMKSSSYEARIGAYAYHWDENGNRKDLKLDEKTQVTLAPNSLVFFETKEEFRLPSYMAIRFNLRITNVHRGLLLGTGPLVDPGFQGKLLVPIHNLTNNSYDFSGDEPFIWVEFTKISTNNIWWQETNKSEDQHGVYEPFPDGKKNLKPAAYFEKANRGNSIQNAVPEALVEVKKTAGDAKAQANSAKTRVNIITFGGFAAAVIAVIGFYPLVSDSVSLSKDISKAVSEVRRDYETNTRDKIANQQARIDNLEKAVDALQSKLRLDEELQVPSNPSHQ